MTGTTFGPSPSWVIKLSTTSQIFVALDLWSFVLGDTIEHEDGSIRRDGESEALKPETSSSWPDPRNRRNPRNNQTTEKLDLRSQVSMVRILGFL